MLAQSQCITLFYSDHATCKINAIKKVSQHLHGLCTAYQLHTRISLQHPSNECRVIGLHVVSHQVVRLSAVQSSRQILFPLLTLSAVSSIHHCYLLIINEIRVITHALGHHILALKQIDVQIVYTDILYAVTN